MDRLRPTEKKYFKMMKPKLLESKANTTKSIVKSISNIPKTLNGYVVINKNMNSVRYFPLSIFVKNVKSYSSYRCNWVVTNNGI